MTRLRSHHGIYTAALAEFHCLHCQGRITADPRQAGVQNRNHCPYCLWSRHVDLARPGDRMAACRAKMQPVGLTLKIGKKKYGPTAQGELMLVHICADCGKVSINRIAADDDADTILAVLEAPVKVDERVQQRLIENGIQILRQPDQQIVIRRLFGGRQPSWAG